MCCFALLYVNLALKLVVFTAVWVSYRAQSMWKQGRLVCVCVYLGRGALFISAHGSVTVTHLQFTHWPSSYLSPSHPPSSPPSPLQPPALCCSLIQSLHITCHNSRLSYSSFQDRPALLLPTPTPITTSLKFRFLECVSQPASQRRWRRL